jgi:transglutaminase-like putative cysteine protease
MEYFTEPRPFDKVRAPHRYKAGDTVQDKRGNAYHVDAALWCQFRWFPLDPVYALQGEDGRNIILDDGDVW